MANGATVHKPQGDVPSNGDEDSSTREAPAAARNSGGGASAALAGCLKAWATGQNLATAAVLTLLAALLLLWSLEQRLPELGRPYWEDEVHHNYQILRAKTIGELRWSIASQMQPMLDHLLRKLFWFNLLGNKELQLRLPSLAASLANVVAAFVLAYVVLRKSGRTPLVATLAAFSIGCWVVANPTEVHYAAEARHYALVSLVSLLWAAAFFLNDETPSGLRAGCSAVFVNTHIWAAPLICTAHALQVLRAPRGQRLAKLIEVTALLAAILAVTAIINYPGLKWLLTNPPHAVGAQSWGGVVEAAREGLGLWRQYASYLALPVPLWACGTVLLAAGLVGFRRHRNLGIAVMVFGLLPVFLVYCRVRSNWSWGDKYFMPFFGLGFAVLVAVFDALFEVIGRTGTRLRAAWVTKAGHVALAVGLLVLSGAPKMLVGTGRDASNLYRPSSNFSPYFLIYGELQATHRPIFVLHSHCWGDDIPLMYLEHMGDTPYRFGYQVADAKGCESRVEDARERLALFLQSYPKGIVVLDEKEDDCASERRRLTAGGVTVERIRASTACVWTVSGATSVEEVGAVARSIRFPAAPGLF